MAIGFLFYVYKEFRLERDYGNGLTPNFHLSWKIHTRICILRITSFYPINR